MVMTWVIDFGELGEKNENTQKSPVVGRMIGGIWKVMDSDPHKNNTMPLKNKKKVQQKPSDPAAMNSGFRPNWSALSLKNDRLINCPLS